MNFAVELVDQLLQASFHRGDLLLTSSIRRASSTSLPGSVLNLASGPLVSGSLAASSLPLLLATLLLELHAQAAVDAGSPVVDRPLARVDLCLLSRSSDPPLIACLPQSGRS